MAGAMLTSGKFGSRILSGLTDQTTRSVSLARLSARPNAVRAEFRDMGIVYGPIRDLNSHNNMKYSIDRFPLCPRRTRLHAGRVFRGFLSLSVIIGTLFAATGCGDQGSVDAPRPSAVTDQSSGSEARSQKEAPQESREDAVLIRAREWWSALVSKDYPKAYSYISPGIRTTISEEAFQKGVVASPVLWSGVEETAVKCSTDVACRIDIEVSYLYMGSLEAFRGQTMTTKLGEKWIFTDGAWYVVYGQ